eukprot:TRINITY_DN10856_c0_g2_i7.p3 TRINITY_DN10856_c0_g2~~TRINITY_DN10856_c0_g2_i7.p3  ORF type:complete len:189 (-),score=4.41 TRINITY_DN10856_c0_g2_i7:77-643(-)
MLKYVFFPFDFLCFACFCCSPFTSLFVMIRGQFDKGVSQVYNTSICKYLKRTSFLINNFYYVDIFIISLYLTILCCLQTSFYMCGFVGWVLNKVMLLQERLICLELMSAQYVNVLQKVESLREKVYLVDASYAFQILYLLYLQCSQNIVDVDFEQILTVQQDDVVLIFAPLLLLLLLFFQYFDTFKQQ